MSVDKLPLLLLTFLQSDSVYRYVCVCVCVCVRFIVCVYVVNMMFIQCHNSTIIPNAMSVACTSCTNVYR